MFSSRPPLSSILPPIVLGTTTFNHQYNSDPLNLPTSKIIHSAIARGINAFDTSPYYGPAETLLGTALSSCASPRDSYIISTKVGRIAAEEFDYSPTWIRKSIARSLERLGTQYLDIVYCHDVEFVTPAEVVIAVKTLRELRNEGKIRYVGISGYPTSMLVELAIKVRKETGEALDIVMSYAHYTLQNTVLAGPQVLDRLVKEGGVDCVLNGSPLGMGLLRSQGVPIGDMGDFHPAPKGLRNRCAEAAKLVERHTGKEQKLEILALRYSIEGWAQDGAKGGTRVNPLMLAADGKLRSVSINTQKIGVSVASVSSLHELDELLEIWGDVVKMQERRFLWAGVQKVFAGDVGREEWRNYSWPSPGVGYVRSKL